MAYLPGYGGGGYGGYGGGQLEQFQPINLDQLEHERQDYQATEELGPAEIDAQRAALQQKNALSQAGFGNSMLSQVAMDAQAADPDEAPTVWDNGMRKLADQGVGTASQYIGRYRPDLAERVGDIYGGKAQAPAGPQYNPQALFNAVQQIPPEQRATILQRQNAAITGFNNVKDEASWNQELGNLVAINPNVAGFFPKGNDWRVNYGIAKQLINQITPFRDALSQQVMAEGSGMPGGVAPLMPKGYGAALHSTGQVDENGNLIMYDGTGNIVAGPKLGAKPSAGATNFDMKRQAWLGVHPGDDDGALLFANGKRDMSEAQTRDAAMNQATRQYYNEQPTTNDPDGWINQRAAQNYEFLKMRTGSSGGTAGPAPDAWAKAAGAYDYWAKKSPNGVVRNTDGTAANRQNWIAKRAAKNGARIPPPANITLLRQRPDLAPQFDQKYGQGASQAFLGR